MGFCHFVISVHRGANEFQSTDQMFILYLIKFLAIHVCIAKVLLVKRLKAPC